MKKTQVTLNKQIFFNKFVRHSSWILLILVICAVSYISFIQDFNLSVRVKTVVALVGALTAAVILLWQQFYTTYHEKGIMWDISKGLEGVHEQYYFGRRGFTDEMLRARITKYNHDAKDAFIKDCQQITGRTLEEITVKKPKPEKVYTDINRRKWFILRNWCILGKKKVRRTLVKQPRETSGRYRGNTHWIIIWKLKHKRYPPTGITHPKQLLDALSVGESSSYTIDLNKSSTYFKKKFAQRIFTSIAMAFFGGGLTVQMINGDGVMSAIYTLVVALVSIALAVIGGAVAGAKGANLKLESGRQATKLLNDWRVESEIYPLIQENLQRLQTVDIQYNDYVKELQKLHEHNKKIEEELNCEKVSEEALVLFDDTSGNSYM